MSRACKLYQFSNPKLISDKIWIPYVSSVRHRYYADKIVRGPVNRKRYRDNIHTEGPLPHCKDHEKEMDKVRFKDFRPINPWSRREALFGINDYIDILGKGNLHPTEVSYNVPSWLRGFQGSEYQLLNRRRKAHGDQLKELYPTKFKDMEKRRKYLYDFLNRKTQDFYWKRP